jgi:hypothetical protein
MKKLILGTLFLGLMVAGCGSSSSGNDPAFGNGLSATCSLTIQPGNVGNGPNGLDSIFTVNIANNGSATQEVTGYAIVLFDKGTEVSSFQDDANSFQPFIPVYIAPGQHESYKYPETYATTCKVVQLFTS